MSVIRKLKSLYHRYNDNFVMKRLDKLGFDIYYIERELCHQDFRNLYSVIGFDNALEEAKKLHELGYEVNVQVRERVLLSFSRHPTFAS